MRRIGACAPWYARLLLKPIANPSRLECLALRHRIVALDRFHRFAFAAMPAEIAFMHSHVLLPFHDLFYDISLSALVGRLHMTDILFDTWDRMFGRPAQAVLVEGSFTADGSGMTALLAAAGLANDERVDQKIASRKAATTPEASDSSPIIDVTAEAPAPAPAPASTWQEKPLSADPEPRAASDARARQRGEAAAQAKRLSWLR